MVRELGPTTPTRELADILNARGITTGTGRQYDTKAVQWIRHAYRIPAPTAYAANEISVADAAARLGCSTLPVPRRSNPQPLGRSPAPAVTVESPLR